MKHMQTLLCCEHLLARCSFDSYSLSVWEVTYFYVNQIVTIITVFICGKI